MADEVSQNVDFPRVLRAYTQNQPILNEWTNHSAFYAIYPSYYFTFANMWLRKWLQWFDGFVPGIHDGVSGIISTRLATTLCYRLGEQVFGGGLLYSNSANTKDAKQALKFISGKFNEDADIDNQLLKAFILAAAGGTSYAKTNKSNDGELWVDTWRADQCWSDVDFKGKVNRAKFLIAKYTKTVPNRESESNNFYLVEERFIATRKDAKEYKKEYHDQIQGFILPPNLHIGQSYVRYQVFRLQGQVNDFNQGVNLGRALNWEDLPKDIKQAIIDAYGTIKLNVPNKLPFIDLGVDMFKWTSFISNLPQLPYGESVIAKIQAYLFEYDFVNSAMNTDVYLGRGRVMIPKSLQSPRPSGVNGMQSNGGYNQGLDSFIFTKVDYATTEDKKPEAIQFELRSQEWINTRNNLLESIATAIGISPSTIASYLNDASARTAREISSEESATALFVENRRKLLSKPINDLISRVLLYYGFSDCVVAKFSKSGQTNTTLVTENTISAYNAKLMSQYQAVKNINPDMSEEELQAEISRINEEQERLRQENEQMDFNDNMGEFGGVNEEINRDSEETKPELAVDTD